MIVLLLLLLLHGVESVWLAGCDCGELPEEVKHVDETLATPVQA